MHLPLGQLELANLILTAVGLFASLAGTIIGAAWYQARRMTSVDVKLAETRGHIELVDQKVTTLTESVAAAAQHSRDCDTDRAVLKQRVEQLSNAMGRPPRNSSA